MNATTTQTLERLDAARALLPSGFRLDVAWLLNRSCGEGIEWALTAPDGEVDFFLHEIDALKEATR